MVYAQNLELTHVKFQDKSTVDALSVRSYDKLYHEFYLRRVGDMDTFQMESCGRGYCNTVFTHMYMYAHVCILIVHDQRIFACLISPPTCKQPVKIFTQKFSNLWYYIHVHVVKQKMYLCVRVCVCVCLKCLHSMKCSWNSCGMMKT